MNFSSVAKIRCRSSSQPLQRVMTDLGIDHAFGRVSSQLKEHYGIDMPVKANQAAVVLTALEPFWERDRDDPVTACHRCISNRLSQLDYQRALERKLPIGSGEIESTHRYVIQERIKLPGAWWKPSNIEAMLALRIKRANNDWKDLWSGVEKRVV